ncbi:hypothetical protein B1757_09475 [Acidithiobacillus marinus]|uniref:YaiO beta-barrel domain-containing protein n=1 Tax=Acidithiobacillus marinus TaxID=187490 RepID=A0A2I1DKU7_9PROT|nr:tetratricopeptide repeat protein [Acidithiobacillus marinus]PKY10508.1 hypothetical protein B1757_09475 [Acidithiobacillus marinus]
MATKKPAIGSFLIYIESVKVRMLVGVAMLVISLVPISASGHVESNENGNIKQKINTMLYEHKNKEALAEAKEKYQRNQNSYAAGLLYSRALLANQQLEMAIGVLQELSKKYPGNSEIESLILKYGNYKKIKELESFFEKKEYEKSINIGQNLFYQGVDSYRSGMIVAQSEFRLGHYQKSIQIYEELIKKYPEDNSLIKEKKNIEMQMVASQASLLVKEGHWIRAVDIASPYFERSENPDKNIGLILAKAYMQGKKEKKAMDIYAYLIKKYPQDADISLDYMNALLTEYHDQQALEFYNALPVKSKSKVFHILGENLSHYYTNYIMTYGGAAASTKNYPVDNEVGIAVNKTFKKSALYLSVSRWNRFHQDATRIEGIYYFELKNGYDAYVGGEYSPENNFLAHYGFLAGLSKSIKNINIYGGIRQLEFTALSATVLSLGARYYFVEPVSLGLTLYYVPKTTAYSIMLSPEWNFNTKNRLYGNISWGMAGENLGVNLGILNTPSINLLVGDSYRVVPHIEVGVQGFLEYRKALYNRVGGLGYVRYWW